MDYLFRLHPELADNEHLDFERLHAGSDQAFNAAYDKARQKYFSLLQKPIPEPPVIQGEPVQPEHEAQEQAPVEAEPVQEPTLDEPEHEAQDDGPAEPEAAGDAPAAQEAKA